MFCWVNLKVKPEEPTLRLLVAVEILIFRHEIQTEACVCSVSSCCQHVNAQTKAATGAAIILYLPPPGGQIVNFTSTLLLFFLQLILTGLGLVTPLFRHTNLTSLSFS